MISCGCTRQGPGSVCERGKKLFTVATRIFQDLVEGRSVDASDEWWATYTFALLAYIDHLRGWWAGDVKVQRRMGLWMLFVRSHGQWIFHFGTEDESLVREWLAVREYQQFAGRGPNDSLSGYYRKGDVRTNGEESMMSPSFSREQSSGVVVSRDHAEKLETPDLLSSSLLDLQTQMAIYIAMLIAHIPHIPTTMERLLVRQRAASVLQARGIQLGPPDEQLLQAIFEEAIRQQAQIRTPSARNTRVLQEEDQRNRPSQPLS